MHVSFPPDPVTTNLPRAFLAGTIDLGKSRDWQSLVVSQFKDLNVQFINPRRPQWDTSWNEYKGTHPEMAKQIQWELSHQNSARVILMWFEAGSQSPITLLELGLFAHSVPMIVGCPDGYVRASNVYETIKFLHRNKPDPTVTRVTPLVLVKTWGEFLQQVGEHLKHLHELHRNFS